MLRLLDAHTRSVVEVRPGRPGLLLACAQVPGAGDAADLTGPRVLLLADLLFRAAELDHLQVFYALDGQSPVAERAIEALGMHPPAARVSAASGAEAALGGPVDVWLAVSGSAALGGLVDGGLVGGGLVVTVGTARLGRAAGTVAGLLGGDEPMAVRLALLSVPFDEPAGLSAPMLAEARATVGQWRLRVAKWAESPSGPVPARVAAALRSAFGDLDAVSVLALLRDLEADPDVPAGAKFETFLYADRLLGLDLPRDIGRV